LESIRYEAERKDLAFSSELINSRLANRDQLSRALQAIVVKAYKLLNGISAELALFDDESGVHHSSFVIGEPRTRPDQIDQAMSEPIAFAGTVFGVIKVYLKNNLKASQADREILRLLALLSAVAIANTQYTQELFRMKQASEETLKAKTGFLANLSHEIRGPLGIILNAVELVLDGLCGELKVEQHQTLTMVKSNSAHLLELINDVLDYAKTESGKVTPDKVEIPAQDFLNEMSLVVRAQAEAKQHKLTVRQSKEAIAFLCDRRHARQILINLLTNAIKYTPQSGTIDLYVERIPGNRIRICVKDNGIGIANSQREKVFAPFERINDPYALNQLGTGLGMPLTRGLAELNGGTVDFDSEVGKGSTFWVTLTAVQFNPFISREERDNEKDAKGHYELTLVVGGDDGERDIITRYLKHIGFQVISCKESQQLKQAIVEYPFALVIIDQQFVSTTKEYDPIKLIVSSRKESPPLTILLSSHAFTSDIEQSLREGIDRYLSKPVALKELGHVCRALLDSKQLNKVRDNQARGRQGPTLH
jgi:signal transduction histidine kinase/ActR/RegA family two-component response regulator